MRTRWFGQETFYCLVLSFLLSREFSKLLWKIRKKQKIISKTALSVTVIFAIVSIWNASLYGFTERMNRWAIKT